MDTDAERTRRALEILDSVGMAVIEGAGIDPAAVLSAHPDLADILEPSLRAYFQFAADVAIVAGSADDLLGATGKTFGDLTIDGLIGSGGMGTVYKATRRSTGRRVALKVLDALRALDPRLVARFEREAQAAASLRHPGLVPVHERGVHKGTPYFVMDLVEGESLDGLLGRLRVFGNARICASGLSWVAWAGLSPQDDNDVHGHGSPLTLPYLHWAAGVIADLCDAADHAHERGVVHRDIKPANILIDRDGRAVLADFGLAQLADSPALTQSREYLGTPKYSSPEQAAGRPLDARTDVYSLGVVLYEMVTLRAPFEGADSEEVRRRIATLDPPRPRRENPAVPPDLESIILKAIEKTAERRYQSAREFGADLQAFLRGDAVTARLPSRFRSSVRFVRRHRIAATVFVVAVVAMIVGAHKMLRPESRGWTRWEPDRGGNGHWYRLTNPGLSWDEADKEAEAAGGHLATITSRAENYWLVWNFGLEENCWIGLHRTEPGGKFVWVTGEPVEAYQNWVIDEPNNLGGAEQWVEIKRKNAKADTRLTGTGGAGQWNDVGPDLRMGGIIEFEGDDPP